MLYSGGHFVVRRKIDTPDTWLVEWSSASSAGGHESKWLAEDGSELDPNQFWDTCAGAKAESTLVDCGLVLWRFLTRGAAGDEWRKAHKSWKAAKQPSDIWRTGLEIKDPALEVLPWELMWDEEYDTPAWTSESETFCRISTEADQVDPNLADGWPWRILVLTGTTQPGVISAEAELEAIHRAWWPQRDEVVIRDALPSGKQELHTLIQQFKPHILHFTGHGKPKALRFQPEGKPEWEWSATDIGTCYDKGKRPVPWLVWLNACQSADKPLLERASAQRSLQQVFRKLGVPCVIGVRGEIDGEMAAFQAGAFYTELTQGSTIDASLARARERTSEWRDDASQLRPISLHQPYLVSAVVSAEEAVLRVFGRTTGASDSVVQATPIFGEVERWFVDRHTTRSLLFDGTLGRCAQATSSQLVIFHGPPQSGKSWVLYFVLKALVLRGWLVRCHRMNGTEALNWLSVLKLVREGVAVEQRNDNEKKNSKLIERLPDAGFAAFDAALDLAVKKPAGEWSEIDISTTFQSFLQGLESCGRPVAIALDQISSSKSSASDPGVPVTRPEWLELWEEHFFKPIAQRRNAPILAFAIMDDATVAEGPFHGTSCTHAIGPIGSGEMAMAIRLYFTKWLGDFASEEILRKKLNDFIKDYHEFAGNDGVPVCELREAYSDWVKPIKRTTKFLLPVPDQK